MKKVAIVLLSICTLSSAFCRAESVTHNLDDMVDAGTLTFPNRASSDYTVGVTDLVTYTGSAGGGFGLYEGDYCIALPKDGVIQTSPAVENLTYLTVTHTLGVKPTGVSVLISTDNSTWTDISSSEICSIYDIDVPMPTKGDYYLKVVNKTGAAINLLQFKYICDPCHCLRVVSE